MVGGDWLFLGAKVAARNSDRVRGRMLGGYGGMPPPENFDNLHALRVNLKLSEGEHIG